MTAKTVISTILFFSFSLALLGQQKNAELETIPTTELSFEQTEFNFGDITEGEIIQNVVTFTNTGEEPLVISNVKATCGCTVPMWPKEPIMPGESADLLVQFDSKNKGAIKGKLNSKRVTITANTDPVNSYVTIKGTVHKSEDKVMPERFSSFDIDPSTVKLWPNPVTNFVQLDLGAYDGKSAVVEVYNMIGERLENREVNSLSKAVMEFDLSSYEAGMYTISINIEGHNRIAKSIMKQ